MAGAVFIRAYSLLSLVCSGPGRGKVEPLWCG